MEERNSEDLVILLFLANFSLRSPVSQLPEDSNLKDS